VRAAAGQLGPLGLSARARAVAAAITSDEPGGYEALADVIRAALRDPELTGWMVWPVTEAVTAAATRSLASRDFEDGLELLAELTPRLTSEFAIRTFLDADLDRTLATVLTWTGHEDHAVRRLASEGTRPKLPWARQVPAITRDPRATVPVLNRLYGDESEFDRRSVANHLNDTSRLDPALAVRTAARWSEGAARTPVPSSARPCAPW
jgi:3-methyladenine DNA glycosylase AlkC